MLQRQGVVLIVDDDMAVRNSLKFSLELDGMNVRAYGSGVDLLEVSDLSTARCMVLDLKMPVMDGFELLDRLAARRVNIPVILITSQATNAIRRRAKDAGVKVVLEKPLLDAALSEAIQTVLDGSP